MSFFSHVLYEFFEVLFVNGDGTGCQPPRPGGFNWQGIAYGQVGWIIMELNQDEYCLGVGKGGGSVFENVRTC